MRPSHVCPDGQLHTPERSSARGASHVGVASGVVGAGTITAGAGGGGMTEDCVSDPGRGLGVDGGVLVVVALKGIGDGGDFAGGVSVDLVNDRVTRSTGGVLVVDVALLLYEVIVTSKSV